MQNDFALPGALAEVLGTADVIPGIQRLLGAFRARSLPIVHVVRVYLEDGSNAELCRRGLIANGMRIVAPGSRGADLVDSLKPSGMQPLDFHRLLSDEFQEVRPNEWVMYKPRWGAFYRTNLENFLRTRNVDTLVFSGCNYPNCPRASIYEASERDFRIVLAYDAVSRVTEKNRVEMSQIGVNVMRVEEIVRSLQME
ncbi:MAG: cysteine hydrolase [Alicyclobacillus sp.]|nr:cysteine hydrolase [Alicyclobacillus sp.]